eukprot:1712391-Rhodomonas_salina.1
MHSIVFEQNSGKGKRRRAEQSAAQEGGGGAPKVAQASERDGETTSASESLSAEQFKALASLFGLELNSQE